MEKGEASQGHSLPLGVCEGMIRPRVE